MFRHNNFACGLCLSIVALTATMCLYNVSRGDEFIKRKKPQNINIEPFFINIFQLHSNGATIYDYGATKTFPDQYLPTPLECSENLRLWCNKIFTIVSRLHPSLGFVTAQEIHNTKNKNKKRRRNLDSGSFRPRVITFCCVHMRRRADPTPYKQGLILEVLEQQFSLFTHVILFITVSHLFR